MLQSFVAGFYLLAALSGVVGILCLCSLRVAQFLGAKSKVHGFQRSLVVGMVLCALSIVCQ